jgi:DnaJ-class molecular chaperone
LKCDQCNGFGKYINWKIIPNGANVKIAECPKCSGKGRVKRITVKEHGGE